MISDILGSAYPYVKSLHIISVVAWMAGLFYLPRLFVYHVEAAQRGDSRDEIFQVMELKLFRVIMNPAMMATYVFGLTLAFTPGVVDWASVWPYTKIAGIGVLTWFHHWLGAQRKAFIAGENEVSGRTYRLMNEVPTICLVVIVFSVVVRF